MFGRVYSAGTRGIFGVGVPNLYRSVGYCCTGIDFVPKLLPKYRVPVSSSYAPNLTGAFGRLLILKRYRTLPERSLGC